MKYMKEAKKTGSILILLVFVVLALSGCASVSKLWPFHGKKVQKEAPKTEEQLQEEANRDFRKGRFTLAEEVFQKIKDRYPFSPYATIAELRLADCKFFKEEYEEAIPLYEEFERLHPTHSYMPYAIFQEGTCYYRLMASPDRDQSFTHKAIETYERLLRRYPDSPYSFEAKRRVRKARDRLAAHELVVAKWYIRVKQYKQALARLEGVLTQYPDTPTAQEAKTLKARVSQRLEAQEKGQRRSLIRRILPF